MKLGQIEITRAHVRIGLVEFLPRTPEQKREWRQRSLAYKIKYYLGAPRWIWIMLRMRKYDSRIKAAETRTAQLRAEIAHYRDQIAGDSLRSRHWPLSRSRGSVN